ncbi:MAG: hypothetical protein EOP37_11200 [Rubrivivax sp.]|nr:MAG: hypothetical protein EOP37_11200 [Rubrivivax sp.]
MKKLQHLVVAVLCFSFAGVAAAADDGAKLPVKSLEAALDSTIVRVKQIQRRKTSPSSKSDRQQPPPATAEIGDDNCDLGLRAGTSAARTSPCLPDDLDLEWELDLDFFNSDRSEWVPAIVDVVLPKVVTDGVRCRTTVSTPYGTRSVGCDDIGAVDFIPIGINNDSRSGLIEVVKAVQVDDLGKISSIAAGEWRKNIPCVNDGESGPAYMLRAKADCTGHVYDQLPSLGTLGQRKTAAAQACNALSAEIAEVYSVGLNQCK